jgi:hypothetical protein
MNNLFIYLCAVYLATLSVGRLYNIEDWNEIHASYVQHT